MQDRHCFHSHSLPHSHSQSLGFSDLSHYEEPCQMKHRHSHFRIEKCELETRILDFLDREGVEFQSPLDKMYDYLDYKRKKKLETCENHSNKDSENVYTSDESKFSKFKLNSKLYFCRVSKSLIQNNE